MFSISELESIYIEITSKCNMNCVFCPYGVLKREKCNLKKELVFKVLNELAEEAKSGKDVPVLAFHCLGEPLLNPYLHEYLDFCDKNSLKYNIVSNGTLFTDKNLDKLFSHTNIAKLEISFHTISEKTFSLRYSLNSNHLSFDSYLDHIKRAVFNEKRILNNIPLQVDVMFDKNLDNGDLFNAFSYSDYQDLCSMFLKWRDEIENAYPQIRQLNKAFYKKSKPLITESFAIYRDPALIPKDLFFSKDLPKSILWISIEILPKVFITIKRFFIFTPNTEYLEQIIERSKDVSEIKLCKAKNFNCSCNKSLVILSDGRITFCCLDYEGVLSCGNISDMTISQAINSSLRKSLLEKNDSFEYCSLCYGKKEFVHEKKINFIDN